MCYMTLCNTHQILNIFLNNLYKEILNVMLQAPSSKHNAPCSKLAHCFQFINPSHFWIKSDIHLLFTMPSSACLDAQYTLRSVPPTWPI